MSQNVFDPPLLGHQYWVCPGNRVNCYEHTNYIKLHSPTLSITDDELFIRDFLLDGVKGT